MKNTSFIIISSLMGLLTACQTESTKRLVTETKITSTNNALLAETVTASYISSFQTKEHHPWKNDFDHKSIFDQLLDKLKNKNIEVYNADLPIEFISEALTKKEVKQLYKNKKDIVPNFKELYSYEAWDFDLEKLQFHKNVYAWCPIHIEYQEDPPRTKRKKYFYIRQSPENLTNDDRGELVAQNMVTQLSFLDDEPHIIGLDQVLFRKKVYQAFQSGKIKIYNASYFENQKPKELLSKDIEQKYQFSLEQALLNQELTNLVFLEDWYLNMTNYQLSKEVKAIGFVGENYYDNWDIDGNIIFTLVLTQD